ncbi:MAG TPA: 4-(cytidine 5'-diphospho)-2-C-methyl-D-erythritol kinase [Rubrivivax sp.]|nr:4-(cytidine 5'-diphospho)-2-C-methyl-D-erythritol kinase [Rubrivivax sp.]
MRALYELPAPAKLNLFLHVLGRRADGYHLLQSAFVLIDWADTLHIELRDDGLLNRHDLGEPLPAEDLCLRAARALQSASACSLGADISIDKQVPAGAGMGGGSSDAATVLLGLNHLWRLNWPKARLQAIAVTLGADVPFFVDGYNALVEGIGERLTRVPWPPATYAVVKPPASVSTREIFEQLDLGALKPSDILVGSPEGASPEGVDGSELPAGWTPGFGTNHLQPAAEIRCPEVAQAARLLAARYGNSRMTGSGSAVFARVGSDRSEQSKNSGKAGSPVAAFPAEELDDLPKGWVGRVCRSLQQHPLADWAG